MAFLKPGSKQPKTPGRLPSGSFTIDSGGQVLCSTLPQSFPQNLAVALGRTVLAAFREAGEAGFAFSELAFYYASLRISAKEMRGGAMIILSPKY